MGVVASIVVAVMVVGTASLVIPGNPGETRWYLVGWMHAVSIAAFLFMVWSWFMAYDGTAVHQLRGAWGEENTRDELKRARRRRLIWGSVDSIELQVGDIDHLVVTRRSGVVAIDSKWRSDVEAEDLHAMARSAQRTALRAEAVIRSVLDSSRSGRRASGKSVRVTPLIVVWGAAQADVPQDAHVEGVRFLKGRDLIAWLRSQTGDPISAEAARVVVKRMEEFRATAWRANVENRT